MVTEDPTNLGFVRIDERNFLIGGERVYGGGYVEEVPLTLDRGIWVQFRPRVL